MKGQERVGVKEVEQTESPRRVKEGEGRVKKESYKSLYILTLSLLLSLITPVRLRARIFAPSCACV
jgi:hypothetical protein